MKILKRYKEFLNRPGRIAEWERLGQVDLTKEKSNLSIALCVPGVPNFISDSEDSLMHFDPFPVLNILEEKCINDGGEFMAHEHNWILIEREVELLGQKVSEKNVLGTLAFYFHYQENEAYKIRTLEGLKEQIRTDLQMTDKLYLVGHSFGTILIHDALAELLEDEPILFEIDEGLKEVNLVLLAPPYEKPLYGKIPGKAAVTREQVEKLVENKYVNRVYVLGMDNDPMAGSTDIFEGVNEEKVKLIRGVPKSRLGQGKYNPIAHKYAQSDKEFMRQFKDAL